MKYMLLIYGEEGALTEAQREHCYQESAQYAHQLNCKGQYIAASPLQPTSTATSLHFQNGQHIMTDGPFAEVREQLGGYFLVNAKDLDEAIKIAAGLPAGRFGTVEIRPLVEVDGLPDSNR